MPDTLRSQITNAIKTAMREKDLTRLGTLRLVNAAIKDKDIDLRAEGRDEGASVDELIAIMAKMVKQRAESAKSYEEGGRLDLAERERAESEIILEFMPAQLSEQELDDAVSAAIAERDAQTIRDMGPVMGLLKERFAGRMDFAQAGALVRARLCGNG